MENLVIRTATFDDIPSLHPVIESAYRGERSRQGWTTEADLLDGQRIDPEGLEEKLSKASTVVFVAVAPDKGIVGCCEVDQRDDGSSYFGMFAVSPLLQGHGIGRRLISHAEQFAAARWSSTEMRMTVLRQRDDILDWYVRLGYEDTGKTEEFPYGDERFGIPKRNDLEFKVLAKALV